MNFKHLRINPISVLYYYFPIATATIDWITYNKSINTNFQYKIIRQSSHDGTLFFSDELIINVLRNLVDRTSYFKPNGEYSSIDEVKYEIGDIHVLIAYGLVDLPCGRFPGQKERVWIPVKTVF